MHGHAALVVVLVLVVPTVLALDPLGVQDDAGTGGDAPDAMESAALVAIGEHVGALDGLADREDWFRYDAALLQKFHLELTATAGVVRLRVVDEDGVQVYESLASGHPIDYIGMEAASYRFQLSTDDPAPEGASYRFRISVYTTVPQNDAGRGIDATGYEGQTPHLVPDTYSGYLYPPGRDISDPYTISKPWGAWVNATLVTDGRPATLHVVSASYSTQTATSTGAPVTLSTWTDVTSLRVVTSESGEPVNYSFEFHWWVPGLPREENDAGLGMDAPEGFEALPVLAEGVHEGRAQFAWGDDIDHFAFTVPSDRYLDVTFTHVDGRAVFGVYRSDGELVDEAFLFNPGSWRLKAASGEYVLSVHRWYEDDYFVRPLQAVYHIDAHAAALPDVAVTTIKVDPPRTFVPMYKIVRATVANPSALDVTSTVRFYVVDSTGQRSEISAQTVTIGPGSTLEVSSGWGHLGSVGEFTLGVSASTAFDANPANDVAETRAAGLVDPGLGAGVGHPIAIIGGGPFGP